METEKLYSPLNFYLRDREGGRDGNYDADEYWRDEISHEEAGKYRDAIELFMRRDREQMMDGRRGLAEYLDEPLNRKIMSLFPAIELHGDKLWCVADMKLTEPLTPEEMTAIKKWWFWQLADGYGESVEQSEIRVNAGQLYIEPWTSDHRFFIDTEREFIWRLETNKDAADSIRNQTIEAQELHLPVNEALQRTFIDRLDTGIIRRNLMETEKLYSKGFPICRTIDVSRERSSFLGVPLVGWV